MHVIAYTSARPIIKLTMDRSIFKFREICIRCRSSGPPELDGSKLDGMPDSSKLRQEQLLFRLIHDNRNRFMHESHYRFCCISLIRTVKCVLLGYNGL